MDATAALHVLLLLTGFQAFSAAGIPPECREKSADLFFVLDSSSSIHPDDFTKQLRFVEAVTNKFNFGTAVRIGILTFSDNVRHHIALGQHSDKSSFFRAVQRIRQVPGNTNTHLALRSMMRTGFNNARPGIPHIGIVITDGASSERDKTPIAAKEVKEAGYTMFAIGVGPKIDYSELHLIASHPSGDFVYTVNDYSALDSIKDRLAKKACIVTTPLPPTTPVPTILPGCSGTRPLDIVFSIPEQAGVMDTNNYIDFIKEVSRHASISPDKVQMGLAKQIYDTRHEIPLNDSPTGDELRYKLDEVKPKGDRIERVLRHMRTSSMESRQGARDESVKVAILIEDNKLEYPQAVKTEASRAKSFGIHIMVIGVGDRTQPEHLEQVASPGAFFQLDDSDEVAKEDDFRRAVEDMLCEATKGELSIKEELALL